MVSTLKPNRRPTRVLATERSDDLDPFSRRSNAGGLVGKSIGLTYGNGTFAAQGYRMMLQLSGDPTLSKPFLQNPWVYASIMARTQAASSVPMMLVDKNGDKVTKSRLDAVLKRPNPITSTRKLWRAQSIYHGLWGEVFWVQFKKSGRRMEPIGKGEIPDEIWPVPGNKVREVLDKHTGLPSDWEVSGSSLNIKYPEHAVAQFAEVDPYNPLRGIGPMQAAYRTAAKDFAADRYDEALLANGGSPGGVLSLQGSATREQLNAIRDSWREAVERPEKHRRTAVLPLGTTFTQFGFSPKDMEFEHLRTWDREVIMSVFGVTRPILGLTEGLNYASAREAFRVFWEVTIVPYLDFVADCFTHSVLSRIDGPESEYTAQFDLSNVASLKETLDSKVERTVKIFSMGGRTWSEAQELAGWEDDTAISEPDRSYVPSGMTPKPEEVRPAPVAPAAPTPAPAAPSKSEKDEPSDATGLDDQEKVLYWKRLNELLGVHDEKLAKRYKRVMRDMLLFVRKRLRSIAQKAVTVEDETVKLIITEAEVEDALQLNLESWSKQLEEAASAAIGDLFDESGRRLAAEVGVGAGFLNRTDPEALSLLRENHVNLYEGPLSTLAQQVEAKIATTLAKAPASVNTLSAAILETLTELESQITLEIDNLGTRAMRIARSVVTSIENGARLANMQALGVERHSWLSSRDNDVRHPHVGLDGMVRRVGVIFRHNLRYPGDPQASADQVVNCRCTTIPIPNT